MLPKSQRLRKTKDIEALFKQGKSAYFGSLGVKASRNNFNYPRFTILVSKKVSKKAVERNCLKRQLRHQLKQRLPDSLGFDLLVICQPNSLKLSSSELGLELQTILQMLKLL